MTFTSMGVPVWVCLFGCISVMFTCMGVLYSGRSIGIAQVKRYKINLHNKYDMSRHIMLPRPFLLCRDSFFCAARFFVFP